MPKSHVAPLESQCEMVWGNTEDCPTDNLRHDCGLTNAHAGNCVCKDCGATS